MAVRVGDECPCNTEDAGVARERPVCEFGQLSVIARRQVDADLPDLLLHHVVVVQQPVGCGDHAGTCRQLGCAGAIGGQQLVRIGAQASVQRRHRGWAQAHLLRRSQAACMLLQSLDAEQFFAHGLGIGPRRHGCAP